MTRAITYESLLNIVAKAPGNFYWKDIKGVYQGSNDAQAIFLGYRAGKDLIGKTDFDLPWKEHANNLQAIDRQVMETQKEYAVEEVISTPTGKKVTFFSRKIPLYDPETNQVIGIIGTSLDISELKQAQKAAEAASHAKIEFLENMRHDIRTPLTGIVGCAQLLQSDTLDSKKVAEYANDLVLSSNALLDFLNKVLEVIQIATGEIPHFKKKFDVRKQLIDIIDMNKSLAAEKDLSLTFEYDEKIPTYLIGDPVRLQRIVLELITNALSFTEQGEVKLIVKLKKNEAHQVVLKLVVSDTGIGISADKQDEIFIRFKRLSPTYQGKYKGLGLGLSIVKQFTDDLGGEIYVNSQVQQGASFTCLLPFQEPLVMDHEGVEDTSIQDSFYKKPIETIGHAIHADEKAGVGANRILLVEDDKLATRIAQTILSNLNCIIDVAPDAKTALQLIKQHDYHLILMDIGLPDMDGIALAHRIRLQEWQTNHSIPLIGLTAHIGQEKKQRCLDAGMNVVISKPFKKEIAAELLATFVQNEVSNQASSSACPIKGPVLDINQIKDLLTDEKTIKDCRALMISGLNEDLIKLADWYQSSKWHEIGALAHKWQGGAAYFGAKRLQQASYQLNNYLKKRGPGEEANKLYQQLIKEMATTRETCINYTEF